MIVDHLLSVLNDPLTNLASVNLLVFLACLRCISLLLLVHSLPFLHGRELFSLALCLYIGLILLSLDCVQLSLLSRNLALQVRLLFSTGFLYFSTILSLLFNLLHHGDLLGLHLADFLLHRLSLQLLLI